MEYVYRFDHRHSGNEDTLRERLGAKGFYLNAITCMKDPDLRVPPGFTITTDACREVLANKQHRWPRELEEQVDAQFQDLKRENQAESPLLFSVRSGAAQPMLGMLHTVLNVGLSRAQVITSPEAERGFLYDCYRRFLASYGHAVLGIREERFSETMANVVNSPAGVYVLKMDELEQLIDEYTNILAEKGGVPESPEEQLHNAITSVFLSWNSKHARAFRPASLHPDAGTAVNVQVMAFGNRNRQSGTGVAYSRNPVSGKRQVAGDYLFNTQGEDIVRGSVHVERLADFFKSKRLPRIARSLKRALGKLERDLFRDMCEVEFTFDDDRLWILQARKAQPTGRAALEVARSMVNDEQRFITERQAIDRIGVQDLINALHPTVNLTKAEEKNFQLVARGTTTVSPGAAVGMAAFTIGDAEEMLREGESVILIAEYTLPRDAAMIRRVAGVVEFRTGFSSHSMVLARRYGKPFIAGVGGRINLDRGATRKSVCDFEAPEGPYRIATGDPLTLDATNCRLFGLELPLDVPEPNTAVDSLLGWAEAYRPDDFEFRVNANTPEEVEAGVAKGADGVGICRTELMLDGKYEQELLVQLADCLHVKQEQDCAELVKRLETFFVGQLAPMLKNLEHRGGRRNRPFAVRLLDRFPPIEDWPAKHRKFSDLAGLRGVRIGILLEPIYRMQVRAILEAARRTGNNRDRVIEFIVPYVIDPAEMDAVRAMVEKETRAFIDRYPAEMEGLRPLVGPMIETPRAISLTGDIAERSDFISYGTNDLSELVFGLNEREESLAARYMRKGILHEDPAVTLDPSVERMIRASVRRARHRRPDIPVVVASEHAYDVHSIELFLRTHFRYISCMHHQLPVARFAVAKASLALGLKS